MEYKYRVVGIDCADCAAELAEEIRKIDGVLSADIHFMQQKKNCTLYVMKKNIL